MIRQPGDTVKEGKGKSIPTNHYVETALGSLPRALKHDYVITYRGEPLSGKSSLKKQFPETCNKAGIPYGRKTPNGITFHSIRRTVKTNMAVAGVDKPFRDSIFGHALQGMDAHYLVVTDEMLKTAMEKYTKWLDNQLGNVYQTVCQNPTEK